MTGWDINPRALGIVPKEAKVAALKGFHWVTDAHYMCVPKGVSDEKLAVLLDLMNFLLEPEQQAYTYDEGYFYPGPAVKDVPLVDGAGGEPGRASRSSAGPNTTKLIADNPLELPLDAREDGRRVPQLGRADRRAEDEVMRRRKSAHRAHAGLRRMTGRRFRGRRASHASSTVAMNRDSANCASTACRGISTIRAARASLRCKT